MSPSPSSAWPRLELPATIFVHEHCAGGGLAGRPRPDSLVHEGRAMLVAVALDLAALSGVEVVATLDARDADAVTARADLPGITWVRVDEHDAASRFDELARNASGTLVIAPESDGALESTSRRVLALESALLGATLDGAAIAGDKLRTSIELRRAGVPCIEALEVAADSTLPYRVVIKPRDGAGSVGLRVVPAGAMIRPAPGDIVTPWVEGRPASVLVLRGKRGVHALPPTFQHLDATMSWIGCEVIRDAALAARARALALAAVDAVPGLRGLAGVDLILGSSESADRVVEINPRWCSSWLTLRGEAPDAAQRWLDGWLDSPPRLNPAG